MHCDGPCHTTVFDPCPSLMIKGGSDDDAVLCTSDKTYNIRSVTLSNSVLLVSPSPHIDGIENQVVIQDSLKELLELVPAVPKLHRLNGLLKEHVWEEGHEDEEDENLRAVSTRDRSHTHTAARLREIILFSKAKRKRFTLEDAQVELQASEQEIARALKDKHVLTIDGEVPQPLSRNVLGKTDEQVYCVYSRTYAHKVPCARSPRRTFTRSSSSS